MNSDKDGIIVIMMFTMFVLKVYPTDNQGGDEVGHTRRMGQSYDKSIMFETSRKVERKNKRAS